ncbi:threonine ammonia-lyase IlvA [Marinicella sp. S1101]|uniref:threonine ammonia-lyase IlvA n=1 Tax=Marinicella marina TaxID=2996016 RepID=UPI0022609EAF|nr:threonine ammonia-lyase IlvA [Marinicella marina]MCX7552766.1 threonine ammonia-lyase IlvA [Marinicella marina]MDJ1139925.1 threonine ammonia-lyase IlvA [Marinicella marina]
MSVAPLKKSMISLIDVESAQKRLEGVVQQTPLMPNFNYSEHFSAEVLLKREDLQTVRSYKIRGAYNKLASLQEQQPKMSHVVCASAGNHAQGVAFTCCKLAIKATVFMPVTTPRQKVDQVKMFGGDWVKVSLIGDTFDEAQQAAVKFSERHYHPFIHPFDDPEIIAGQATIATELLSQSANENIDYVFVPIGGGGLASGLLSVFKQHAPHTKVIGVEPEGAASMTAALQARHHVKLPQISRFVDGAAVQQVGEHTRAICQNYLDDVIQVPDGLICQTILNLYNKDAIVVEPAGALSLAGLHQYRSKIQGKRVVCILSGSNNDITRIEEIRERALLYNGLKHYFLVRFPQRAGALKEFVADVLGPQDDITYFQYQKKHNREHGPAVVGIELNANQDFEPLLKRMKAGGFYNDYLNNQPELFSLVL